MSSKQQTNQTKAVKANSRGHHLENKRVSSKIESEYEVEKILNESDGKFLVKWKGYPLSEATWEPEKNLKNCKELINQFRKNKVQQKSENNPNDTMIIGVIYEGRNNFVYKAINTKTRKLFEIRQNERQPYVRLIIDYLHEQFERNFSNESKIKH